MNLITYRFGLDLAKHGAQTVLSGFRAGDTNRAIDVSLSVNGEPFYLGADHAARIRTKIFTNGEVVEIEDACTVRDNRIFYKITPEMLQAPGEVFADLEIGSLGMDIFSTARFILVVNATVSDDATIPEDAYNSVITALANSENAMNQSLTNAEVDENGNLIFTLLSGTELDAGYVVGPKGDKGDTGLKGDKGDKGETGPQGEKGTDANYSLIANALKGTVSGFAVAMYDVSPLEHEIGVKLASKNLCGVITANSNVTINDGVVTQITADTASGWIKCVSYKKNGTYVGVLGTGTLALGVQGVVFVKDDTYDLVRFGVGGIARDTLVGFDASNLPNGTYTISGNFTNVTQGSISWKDMQIEVGSTATEYTPFVPLEDTKGGVYIEGVIKNETSTTMLEDKTVYTLMSWQCENDELAMTFDKGGYCQVSTNGLGYEPQEPPAGTKLYYDADTDSLYFWLKGISSVTLTRYGENASDNPQTYTPNADGTVEGVTSLYPSTTLLTDTEGVTITAEYNRDINKAFEKMKEEIKAELQALILEV